MLGHERNWCLDKVAWCEPPFRPRIVALECWQYENVDVAIEDQNWRVIELVEPSGAPKEDHRQTVEVARDWLEMKGLFAAPSPPEGARRSQGGIRLVIVERDGNTHDVGIDKDTFELVEEEFKLHAATLPAFFTVGGSFSSSFKTAYDEDSGVCCQIVVKACQKVEIGNYTLSITHNSSYGWTTGLLIGDGVLFHNRRNGRYGQQFEQLQGAILSSARLWSSPLLLPCVTLQVYAGRVQTHTRIMDNEIVELESLIGITDIGRGDPAINQKEWPANLDTKQMTRLLHWTAPQVTFMHSCCAWMQDYADFLVRLQSRFQEHSAFRPYRAGMLEIEEMVEFLRSRIRSSTAFFDIARERTASQMNLLFSVVGQQDSLLSRRDSVLNLLIANATKEDSISMTTFTFITALFLPCTFVASLFSMTMFDWQTGSDGDTGSTSGVASSIAQTSVSSKFWIYWVIATPLTLFTMSGWYLWFKYANRRWTGDVDRAFSAVAASGNDFATFMINPLSRLDTRSRKHPDPDGKDAAGQQGHPTLV